MSRRVGVAPLALLGLLAGCVGLGGTPGDREAGRPAPALEGADADGLPLRLGDYCGRVVLVSFWHQG